MFFNNHIRMFSRAANVRLKEVFFPVFIIHLSECLSIFSREQSF